jgi:hypothetical protein
MCVHGISFTLQRPHSASIASAAKELAHYCAELRIPSRCSLPGRDSKDCHKSSHLFFFCTLYSQRVRSCVARIRNFELTCVLFFPRIFSSFVYRLYPCAYRIHFEMLFLKHFLCFRVEYDRVAAGQRPHGQHEEESRNHHQEHGNQENAAGGIIPGPVSALILHAFLEL